LDSVKIQGCVASSSDLDRVELSLQIAGLHDCFSGNIFTAQMVARGKPAPDLFLYAAGRMQTVPENCLVIEDSIAGVQAGRAAGMRVFGFFGGDHCPPGHGQVLIENGAELAFADMRELAAELN
jgi:HAD superfamily hydrolase (TIGR01509 family)